MARIRTIKPDFWTDSFMVQLPPLARLVYISLWTLADDHGLVQDEVERLAMEVMPRESGLDFDDWFQFFEASGRLERMVAPDGMSYFKISRWEKHQRVDKPSQSRIAREGSRRLAIPLEVRRQVATKYGCKPGESVDVECYYCGVSGSVHWHRLGNGKPSSWVTFPGLEIDHLNPDCLGGENTCENMVLSCRGCNRSKGSCGWFEFLLKVNSQQFPPILAKALESSALERKGKEEEEEGNGKTNFSPDRRIGVEDIVIEKYHETLPSCQRAETLTPKRKKRILSADKMAQQVCKQQGWEYTPAEFWGAYFSECLNDPWLRGEVPNPKNPKWKQHISVLLDETRFESIMDSAISAMRDVR